MSGFLERVCAEARDRVAAAARAEPLHAVRARAMAAPPPPSFADRIRGGIIAEVKRASPSLGVLDADRDAVAQARAYAAGGASAISVLTEPRHFRGSLADLRSVAAVVPLPVLRKDFIVTPYQLFEARAAGAAAALLLVAALDTTQLGELLQIADEAGVETLIETHDAREIATVSAIVAARRAAGRPVVVGVNARDLRRLSVDRAAVAELISAVPHEAVVVAESGVSGPGDVERYVRAGADAVLVGGHLMRADQPVIATRALVAAARTATGASSLLDPT